MSVSASGRVCGRVCVCVRVTVHFTVPEAAFAFGKIGTLLTAVPLVVTKHPAALVAST